MTSNFLSIIVPVYNVELYIKKCIDSILSQEYSNFELILIDDGSTDRSGKICDDYAFNNNKIRVIHQENGGLSNARNTGIRNATGHYIWFIDSDDWIAENAFSILINELNKDEVEMLGFYESRFFQEENKLFQYNNLKKIAPTDGKTYLKENKNFVPASCFYIYSTNFIKENELSFREQLIHEDDYFNLICFSKVKRIKKIDFVLYYYRIRSNSILNSKIKIERLLSYVKIIELCKNLKKSDLDFYFIDTRIRCYISLLFTYLNKYQIDKKNENHEEVLRIIFQVKQIIPKQVIYYKDKKGIFIEKIIYNYSGKLYYKYKKLRESKNVIIW